MHPSRTPLIAGNWKMYHGGPSSVPLAQGVAEVARALAQGSPKRAVDIVVAPPFTALAAVADSIEGSPVKLAAQNLYPKTEGAFTGEISGKFLKDCGCDWVIVGHSERRQYFGETGEMLKKKVVAALKAGLKVIFCIGETLDEREGGKTEAVLGRQIKEVLGPDVSLANVTAAYEPVWAIGTGRTASPAQAQEAHAFVRGQLRELYGAAAADAVRIQYGGSVKADNAQELMSQPDVDGALVGGASLKAADFLGIINGALAAKK